MGSFWIFFLFLGMVALIKRKEMASQDDTTPQNIPSTEAPTENEKQEIERRIREILGEPQPVKRAAPTQPTAPKQAARTARPKVKAQSARTSLEQITPKTQLSAHRPAQPTPSRSTTNPKKVKTTATEVAGKSEPKTMIDDFTIEKAVIYSEILEPKFKQY